MFSYSRVVLDFAWYFFLQAEDGIRDLVRSRGLGDVYKRQVHKLGHESPVVNLFMDYETFGEHRKVETGIFDFIQHLPNQILKDKQFSFATPSDLAKIKTLSLIHI